MKINYISNKSNKINIELYSKIIKKAFEQVCKEIRQKSKILEINIHFVNNKKIQDLNNKERKIDKPTDVLSFPLLNISNKKINKKNYSTDYNKESKTILLGDIFISIEMAQLQAEQFEHSLLREIVFLAIHGLLHCFGFDHENRKDEKVMFSLQELVLNKCGVKR